MAVEWIKVLTKLDEKFKGKPLTKTFKEKTAKRWAEKIDNDAEIDAYINDREEDLLDTAAEADRRVSEATKKPKETEKTPAEKEAKTDEITFPEDTPEYIKTMMGTVMAAVKGVSDKVDTFQQSQTAKTIKEQFESHPELKGINPVFLKGRTPATAEEIEAAVAEAKADYLLINPDFKAEEVVEHVPGKTNVIPERKTTTPAASKEELDAAMSNIKI